MPPRGVTSTKRKRQYEHVKESELERGVGEDRAEEIAARTVNKQRAKAGETKSARGARKSGRTRKASGGRKSSGRSSAARKSSGARSTSGGRKAPSSRRKTGRKAASKKR